MNTTALEVPKASWQEYFNDLGKQYYGWSITVEVLDPELGDQRVFDGLQGISFETEGSQAGDILIEAGDVGMPFDTHLVRRPRIVRVSTTQSGGETDLDIESEEGVTTLVRLWPRPEFPPSEKT